MAYCGGLLGGGGAYSWCMGRRGRPEGGGVLRWRAGLPLRAMRVGGGTLSGDGGKEGEAAILGVGVNGWAEPGRNGQGLGLSSQV